MKTRILLLLILMINVSVYAQKMRNVDQEAMGMKYKVPKTWEVDGFGDFWYEGGSSVCNCAGTINIGERFEEDDVFMVVYPAPTEELRNSASRLKVWNMVFDENGTKSEFKTEKLTFEKNISKWKDGTGGERQDNEVWQLKTQGEGQFYMFYFWAKPEVLKNNEALITKILESFEPVTVAKEE